MKFGLQMLVGTRWYAEVAAIAEEAGFSSLHVPDHLVYPAELPATYPYAEDGVLRMNGQEIITGSIPTYDPFGLLSYLAGVTRSVELVASPCVVPLYHPLFLARALATVDRLSAGHVALGVGVGWLEDEFDASGAGFHDRGRRTDAVLEILRTLWASEITEWHDEWFDIPPVRFNPKPFGRSSIPIYVGGASPKALERAGRLADGWLEIGSHGLDELEHNLAIIHEVRAGLGRQELDFEVITTSSLVARDDVRRAAELGVTRVIAIPEPDGSGRITATTIGDWARRFHDEVMASA